MFQCETITTSYCRWAKRQMSGGKGSGSGRRGFLIRGQAGHVADPGRGRGQLRLESRRIARPGSRWTRGRSLRRGQ